MANVRRLAMWSGPRNLSTAMMRAFSSRDDTWVWDEPYYAAYLTHSGQHHPMQDAILAAGDSDPSAVAAQCLTAARPDHHVHYQKHMTHHMLPSFSLDWTDQVTNLFLIRHPARVIASYANKRDSVTLADLGFEKQLELFDRLASRQHAVPVVVDADRFLENPEASLMALCAAIGLEYQPAMMRWPTGPHPDDGAWASHWYDRVWASDGFTAVAPPPPLPDLPSAFDDMVARAIDLQAPLAQAALLA